MQKIMLLVYGKFQNPKAREKWIAYFTKNVPFWSIHEGSPTKLQYNSPAGQVTCTYKLFLNKIKVL